jgi:hypothetical protein
VNWVSAVFRRQGAQLVDRKQYHGQIGCGGKSWLVEERSVPSLPPSVFAWDMPPTTNG